MTLDEFKALVKRAEVDIAQRPQVYKTRLLTLAMLGYGFVFGLGVLAIGLLAGSVALGFYSTLWLVLLIKKKLIFALIAVLWVLFKALWVRFDVPTGYVLDPARYPLLFAEIEALRRRLGAPRVHRVIITPQLNTAVVRTPRLGVLGWHRNTLILGLELLLVLSPAEAKSVLAHELGHLSGSYNRFSAWIYSARNMWSVLMDTYDRQTGFAAGWMRRFLDWYVPRFNAYSFALARQNEYEADHLAALFTSHQDAGHALVNVHVTGPYVDQHYWQAFYEEADRRETPSVLPYSGLQGFLAAAPRHTEEMQLLLENALGRATSEDDTHPCLRDRMQALAVQPDVPAPVTESAAGYWLGPHMKEVVTFFDAAWWQNAAPRWQDRYHYACESQRALLQLEAQAAETLDDNSLWDRAVWTEEFRNSDPLPLYRMCLQRQPQNAQIAFAVGRILAQRDDDACLPALDVAARAREWTVKAAEQAYFFLKRHQRETEAEQWRMRAVAQMDFDRLAREERDTLSVKDVFFPPQGLEKELDAIRQQWQAHPKIKRVWVAQKQVKHYPEHPVLVLVVKPRGFIFTPATLSRELLASLQTPLSVFVIVYGGDEKKGAKLIMKKGRRLI